MHRVAFEFVMDDFGRDVRRRVLDLFDEIVADCSGAHVATGRAFACEVFAVVDRDVERESERACAAQQFDGEERTGWTCAHHRNAAA
jgi:hypothetical protein